jgi:hypothetical protein
MAWDHNYRRLNKGEIIRATDEVQNDDASWAPAYTSHRVYRRLKQSLTPALWSTNAPYVPLLRIEVEYRQILPSAAP